MPDNGLSYEEFERDWLRRHKGSLIPKPRVSSWGLIFGLGLWILIATGGALVSGSHSIPAILLTIPAVVTSPAREILANFGFTIFELLIFAGALYRHVRRVAAWGLIVGLIGSLAANVGSSVRAVSENSGDALSLIVAIVLALVAPLAAFLAGEMVHYLYEEHRKVIASAQAIYEQKRRDLDATINAQYARYQKAQRVSDGRQTDRQTVTVSVPELSEQTDTRQTNGQPDRQLPAAFGFSRTSDGQARVKEYLDLFPDQASTPSRKLAAAMIEHYGEHIGHDTVNKGRNAWVQSRQTVPQPDVIPNEKGE